MRILIDIPAEAVTEIRDMVNRMRERPPGDRKFRELLKEIVVRSITDNEEILEIFVQETIDLEM